MTSDKAVPRLCGVFAIIWGAFVAWPWGSVFGKNPIIYNRMLSVVPYEMFWGLLILSVGILCEFFTRRGEIAKACLTISLPFFAFSSLYFLADPSSPAWALWGWLGLYNFLIFWERRKWNSQKV